MANRWRHFDWQIFWLREVLFLSLPWLIVVFALHRGDYIHYVRAAVLLSVQLCLTILNILWALASSAMSENLAGQELRHLLRLDPRQRSAERPEVGDLGGRSNRRSFGVQTRRGNSGL